MNEPTPDDLAERGTDFWSQVVSTYELRVDELAILEDTCRELDLVEDMRSQLADADFITSGSMGQDVAHPLLAEIRHHRALAAKLMAQLGLPDEEAEDEDAATKAQSLSARNRAAAEARWRGP